MNTNVTITKEDLVAYMHSYDVILGQLLYEVRHDIGRIDHNSEALERLNNNQGSLIEAGVALFDGDGIAFYEFIYTTH